mgnify:CR=1 FL=1
MMIIKNEELKKEKLYQINFYWLPIIKLNIEFNKLTSSKSNSNKEYSYI